MDEPTLLTRSELLASGTTVDEIRQALRTGTLRRVARGIYIDGTTDPDPVALHRVRVLGLRGKLRDGAAVSHVSAAVMHGLALWDVDLSRVHISRNRASGGRRLDTLHVHTTSLPPDEVGRVSGVPVTSVARTVVDLARTLPTDHAVVAGDSALRMYPDALPLLTDAVSTARTRTGVAAARRTVEFLDGRSESPGESLSRLRIAAAGLPAPELQYELRTDSGAFVARTDLYWKDVGVVGEFDGRSKYGADEPGATAETVHKEKLREDALRALGLEVVCWTWQELFHFDTVRARLSAAAGRARRR